MNSSQKPALNRRALIALVMVDSFAVLPISGLALHFANNASFQTARHVLMTVHNVDAIIFLIASILHLNLNWKPLRNYIRNKVGQAQVSHIRTEVSIAALVVIAPLALGILHVFALGGR